LLVSNNLPPPEPTPTTEWHLLPVLAILAYPVIEEIAFRGWMQKPLEYQAHPALAIFIPAVIFAVLHSDTFFSLHLLMGCLYGAAAWVSRSVWIAVALHATSNAAVAPLDVLSEVPAVDQWLRATADAGPLWLDVAMAGLFMAGSIGETGWIYGLWRSQRSQRSSPDAPLHLCPHACTSNAAVAPRD
jgi:membrane protease YdiL (CAAX protease family)